MVAPLCPHPGAFWPQVRDGPSGICLSNALESERMRALMLVGKHRDDIRGHDMPHIACLMTCLGDSQHALGAKTLLPRLNMVAGQGVSRSQRTGRPHVRPAWDMHMVTPGGFEPSTPGLGKKLIYLHVCQRWTAIPGCHDGPTGRYGYIFMDSSLSVLSPVALHSRQPMCATDALHDASMLQPYS